MTLINLLQCSVLLFYIQIPSTLFAQRKIKNYVRTEIKTINYISPDSVNFNDMQSIGKAVGDSRIVMLGEQAHGDGATYSAKSRLVKYLHEKKGFTVLAFESDLFALTKG